MSVVVRLAMISSRMARKWGRKDFPALGLEMLWWLYHFRVVNSNVFIWVYRIVMLEKRRDISCFDARSRVFC